MLSRLLILAVLGCAPPEASPGPAAPSTTPPVPAASLVVATAPTAPPATPPPPAPPVASFTPQSVVDERFVGMVTEVHLGCAVDASCDLVVDKVKHVHFGHDTRGEKPTDWGQVDDKLWRDPRGGVGRRVEVFAGRLEPGYYTIQGKSAYYVRLLP